MTSVCWLTLAAWIVLAPPALAQPAARGRMGAEETHVLSALHHANQTQLDAAGLATSRAASSKVKQYAEQVIKDDQQADHILRSYARRAGAEIQDPPVARSDGEQQDAEREVYAMAKLRELDGAAFDRAFLACMVNDHHNALQVVRNARNQVTDPALRSMLNNLLPVLQQHATLAQKLQRNLAASKGP